MTTPADALSGAFTQQATSLAALNESSPLLLIFLRHFG
jgi:hypothetical protein